MSDLAKTDTNDLWAETMKAAENKDWVTVNRLADILVESGASSIVYIHDEHLDLTTCILSEPGM